MSAPAFPPGYRYYAREFLNQRGQLGTASVLAYVREEPRARELRAGLEISDCFRCISIETRADTPEERANTLHKLALLRDCVDGLRAALAEDGER